MKKIAKKKLVLTGEVVKDLRSVQAKDLGHVAGGDRPTVGCSDTSCITGEI